MQVAPAAKDDRRARAEVEGAVGGGRVGDGDVVRRRGRPAVDERQGAGARPRRRSAPRRRTTRTTWWRRGAASRPGRRRRADGDPAHRGHRDGVERGARRWRRGGSGRRGGLAAAPWLVARGAGAASAPAQSALAAGERPHPQRTRRRRGPVDHEVVGAGSTIARTSAVLSRPESSSQVTSVRTSSLGAADGEHGEGGARAFRVDDGPVRAVTSGGRRAQGRRCRGGTSSR